MNKKIYKRKSVLYLPLTIGGFSIDFPTYNQELNTYLAVKDLAVDILDFFISLSAVVAVALIIYSGYMYITSSGDPEKVKKSTNALTAALIGLAIVFLARFVVIFLLEEFLL
jgi:hypothetical protein